MAPSIWQILIVVLVFMLLFGGRRLPTMMEDLAKGINSFKKGLKDDQGEDQPKEITSESKEADKG